MENNPEGQISIFDLINREKWFDILERFRQVLRINLFIVDPLGRSFSMPVKNFVERKEYGWRLFVQSPLGVELLKGNPDFITRFKKAGGYFEVESLFGLYSFAIPITMNGASNAVAMGYLIVGPVILNKRMDNVYYQALAQKHQFTIADVLDAINEIRVVSFVTIKSILDLLEEVAKYMIQLTMEHQELHKMRFKREVLSEKISSRVEDIFSSIYLDELLVTLLDVSLGMTKTECGSIFVLDNDADKFVVKVSRGVDQNYLQKASVKLGQGIIGLVAKENCPLVINGIQSDDNRIRHLLKRPEIKYAMIIPFNAKNNVLGVLNLCTKREANILSSESLETVQNLTKLTSAAIQSIQQRFLAEMGKETETT